MQILQCQNQFGRIKLTFDLRKVNLFNQMVTKVFSAAKIKAQINTIWSLEGEMKADNKWMTNLLQYIYLRYDELYLLIHY